MNTTIEFFELRAFVTVVEHGSFTSAAENLGTDKAHVSRTVSRLEKKLGAQLLVRSTRHLNVTELGRDVFERSSGVLSALQETAASVARAQNEPSGTLRISAGSEFGTFRVTDWIASYLREYPKVRVEADYTNRITDIIHDGIDVAIRISPLPDSDLAARKLGEIDYGLYTSARYLNHKPAIDAPEDLEGHELVLFSPRGKPALKLRKGQEEAVIGKTPRCVVSSTQAALDLVRADLGISLLPKFLVAEAVRSGELKPVLPAWSSLPTPVHAVFASSRYMSPKVRSFVDWAVRHF